MAGLDYAVIAIMVLSALLGWWRGLVYEVLSLLGWVAAWTVAKLFAASAVPYMPAAIGAEAVRTAVAFVVLFVVTLIASGIVAWLLSKLIKLAGLGWLDGLMGVVFGMLRGTLLVLVAVLLAGMTPLPNKPFWHDAWSSRPLENVALTSRAWLPENVAQRISFQGVTGDK